MLLLTIDTLRPDYLGAYGYDRDSSPFLDSLLARGLVFDRATTPAPRTTPALASLLTGQYPHTHGVRRLVDRLGPEIPTIAEAAAAAGYTTLAVVSNHILPPKRGLGRGFDVYDAAPDSRNARQTTRAALSLVRDRVIGDNVFLWVHYIDPHVPYNAPRAFIREMDPEYSGRYARNFGAIPGAIGEGAYPRDLGKRGAVYRNTLPEEVNAHIRRLYAADIRYTDDAIEELLAGLEELRGKDWVVVFTSDHGEALGAHDFFYDHGDYVYEGSLAVPLAIVLPDGDPAHRTGRETARVSLVDIAPTLAELLDWPFHSSFHSPKHPIEGRSLLPALLGESLDAVTVFAESGWSYFPEEIERRVHFDVSGRFRAALDGSWKLIWTPGRPDGFELYDLSADPTEQRDLYNPERPEAKRLHAAMLDWLRSDEQTQQVMDPDDRDRLESLGYIE